MTLRQIIDEVGKEWLEAELTIRIHDSDGRSADVSGDCFDDWPFRINANPRAGEPNRLIISGMDWDVRILRKKK